MRIVKSYDLFDTIIGRKLFNNIDFFNKCMVLNKLEDFTNIRINSEQKCKNVNNFYNIFNIYKFIQEHYNLSYQETMMYINLEIQTEIDNIYPIYTNINKLDSNSIIFTDHYYNSEQIKRFLSKFNIIHIPIYTSNEVNALKSDGSIYTYLKKFYKIKSHIGSNYNLDYEIPNNIKIGSINFSKNKLKDNTKQYFKMMEFTCKNIIDHNSWNLQIYYNLPLLLLFCNTILDFCLEKDILDVIFISRNCKSLKIIFDKLKELKNKNINTSELVISFKLLNNTKYVNNILNKLNNNTKYLFVDFVDSFTSYLNNLFEKNKSYYYNLFNNRLTSTNLINTHSFFTNNIKYTKTFELLNLPNIGAPIDYINDQIIYDNIEIEFSENLINIYKEIIDLLITTINLEMNDDIVKNLLPNIIDNMPKIKSIINNLSDYDNINKLYYKTGNNYIKNDYNDPNYINNLDRFGELNPYLKNIKMTN
jgi:hypothetical protein